MTDEGVSKQGGPFLSGYGSTSESQRAKVNERKKWDDIKE